MRHFFPIGGAIAALLLAGLAHAQSVIVNKEPVPAKVIIHEGRVMIEAAAFARALGATVTWDAKTKTLLVSMPKSLGVGEAAQLPGEWGTIGTPYQLGDNRPVVFTLLEASYTVERVPFGTNVTVPDAGEKLLLLRYTLQNPGDKDMRVTGQTLKFTAVDAFDVNREHLSRAGMQQTKEHLRVDLKPAQKIEAYAVIKVPAKGSVPKLIVEPHEGDVLRFNLTDKIPPLTAPIADPADATGATARETVPGQPGAYYPAGNFDVQYTSAAYTTEQVINIKPRGRLLVINFKVKNGTPVERPAMHNAIMVDVKAESGRLLKSYSNIYLADLDERAMHKLLPGDEIALRAVIDIPEGDKAVSVRIGESDSRIYEYDVRNIE